VTFELFSTRFDARGGGEVSRKSKNAVAFGGKGNRIDWNQARRRMDSHFECIFLWSVSFYCLCVRTGHPGQAYVETYHPTQHLLVRSAPDAGGKEGLQGPGGRGEGPACIVLTGPAWRVYVRHGLVPYVLV